MVILAGQTKQWTSGPPSATPGGNFDASSCSRDAGQHLGFRKLFYSQSWNSGTGKRPKALISETKSGLKMVEFAILVCSAMSP
jgi:hypothetical protein